MTEEEIILAAEIREARARCSEARGVQDVERYEAAAHRLAQLRAERVALRIRIMRKARGY